MNETEQAINISYISRWWFYYSISLWAFPWYYGTGYVTGLVNTFKWSHWVVPGRQCIQITTAYNNPDKHIQVIHRLISCDKAHTYMSHEYKVTNVISDPSQYWNMPASMVIVQSISSKMIMYPIKYFMIWYSGSTSQIRHCNILSNKVCHIHTARLLCSTVCRVSHRI
jgi:hypothetical protein